MTRTHKVLKKIPEDILPAPQAQAVITSLPPKGEEISNEKLVEKIQKKLDAGEIKGEAVRIVALYTYRLRQEGFISTSKPAPAEKPAKTPKVEKVPKAVKSAKPAEKPAKAKKVTTVAA